MEKANLIFILLVLASRTAQRIKDCFRTKVETSTVLAIVIRTLLQKLHNERKHITLQNLMNIQQPFVEPVMDLLRKYK